MAAKDDDKKDFYLKTRQCVICRATYNNYRTLGKLECREHFGMIRDGEWTCCKLKLARSIDTPDEFYSRNFQKELLGCVKCDHKETLEPFSTMDSIDYRELGNRTDASSILVQTMFVDRGYLHPIDESIGVRDREYMEIYRFSKRDFDAILA